jgi:hypothetical protein
VDRTAIAIHLPRESEFTFSASEPATAATELRPAGTGSEVQQQAAEK